MFTPDPISDMITRIRNAHMRGHEVTRVPSSRFKQAVLDVLVREGFIRGYTVENLDTYKPTLLVELKYFHGTPVIREIRRVSKPSVRIYVGTKDTPSVANGLGSAILTTSKGVLSDKEARALQVGGKVLLTVR